MTEFIYHVRRCPSKTSQKALYHLYPKMKSHLKKLQNLIRPSELFSLLWELSSKARWLVILAPHKKPEIKDGWGWSKWNVHAWESSRMVDNVPEILNDRCVPG
ncbi:hypothetical protein C0992_013152 [Termitomyces sp. T32_za158]|nr:hypothetical protein C0992_013152 [Termitomyces sp. T32_za158]